MKHIIKFLDKFLLISVSLRHFILRELFKRNYYNIAINLLTNASSKYLIEAYSGIRCYVNKRKFINEILLYTKNQASIHAQADRLFLLADIASRNDYKLLKKIIEQSKKLTDDSHYRDRALFIQGLAYRALKEEKKALNSFNMIAHNSETYLLSCFFSKNHNYIFPKSDIIETNNLDEVEHLISKHGFVIVKSFFKDKKISNFNKLYFDDIKQFFNNYSNGNKSIHISKLRGPIHKDIFSIYKDIKTNLLSKINKTHTLSPKIKKFFLQYQPNNQINNALTLHQDQGNMSIAADWITCWVPFVDVGNKQSKSLYVLPVKLDSFIFFENKESIAYADKEEFEIFFRKHFIELSLKKSDLLIFDRFFLHRSSTAKAKNDRLSFDCRIMYGNSSRYYESLMQSKQI